MNEPEEWLQDNYRQLAAGRGCEVADLADEFEPRDPQLAAWMRRQGREQKAERKRSAPRARRAPAKSEG